MSEPSLAWTAPTKTAMTEVMSEKVWYELSDQDTLWSAWSTWATASGSSD